MIRRWLNFLLPSLCKWYRVDNLPKKDTVMATRKQFLLTVLLSTISLTTSHANPPLDDNRPPDTSDEPPEPRNEIRPPKPEVIWVSGYWVRTNLEIPYVPLHRPKPDDDRPKTERDPEDRFSRQSRKWEWEWVPGHWALEKPLREMREKMPVSREGCLWQKER